MTNKQVIVTGWTVVGIERGERVGVDVLVRSEGRDVSVKEMQMYMEKV